MLSLPSNSAQNLADNVILKLNPPPIYIYSYISAYIAQFSCNLIFHPLPVNFPCGDKVFQRLAFHNIELKLHYD